MEQLPLWPKARSSAVEVATVKEPRSQELPSVERRSALRLAQWLGEVLGRPVRIDFTANRSTMLSSREAGQLLLLRLHRTFIDAPEPVWHAVAAYVGWDDARAGRLLDAYIANQVANEPEEPVEVHPRGRYHDLDVILAELNARFFHHASEARITWGAPGTRRRRRSIQLGCYVGRERLIRVHPCLDQSFVPRSYVSWVVFHEMLHEIFGVEGNGRRRSLHPPEFMAIEQSYPEYEDCLRWEQENLDRLLRYRPPHQSRL